MSPKLFSQLKHEESELNSILKIRNQMKEEMKTEKKWATAKFCKVVKNFAANRILKVANFHNLLPHI